MGVRPKASVACRLLHQAPTCVSSRKAAALAVLAMSRFVLLSMFTSKGELSLTYLLTISLKISKLVLPFVAADAARDSWNSAAATKNWSDCFVARAVSPATRNQNGVTGAEGCALIDRACHRRILDQKDRIPTSRGRGKSFSCFLSTAHKRATTAAWRVSRSIELLRAKGFVTCSHIPWS